MMKCLRCDAELILQKISLEYLGHTVNQEFPACPVCGDVFIPEDIVSEKMQKVEQILEDK